MNLRTCLSEKEKERIKGDIHDVEGKTSGEIVALIVDASANYPQIDYLGGLLFTLIGFCLTVGILVSPSPYLILMSEVIGFSLGFLLFRLHAVKRLWLTEAYMHHRVERRALRAFYEHRLQETKEQNGILIMVSLLEKRVRVMADRGIYKKVDPKNWDKIAEELASALRTGLLAEGLCEAIRKCGSILSEHFPLHPDDQNNLPDQIVLEKE